MYFYLFIQILSLENMYLEKLGGCLVTGVLLSPEQTCVPWSYVCVCPMPWSNSLEAVQTALLSLPTYKCWMPWLSLLSCRISPGIGQGRMHLVTLQLWAVPFFILAKIKRTCIVQPKGWMLTEDGYQDSGCGWILTCTAYPEAQKTLKADQLLLPPANPSGCEKPTRGALFNCCWMGSSRTVLIFLGAITLRIVQLLLSTPCPNILYVL